MISKYLVLLQRYNIAPNFVCSQEYFDKSQILEVERDGYVFWEQYDWIIAPPINVETRELIREPKSWLRRVWSDFPNWYMPMLAEMKFLDFEYLYNPRDFKSLVGNKWETFRKNVRKFPQRYEGISLSYISIESLFILKGYGIKSKGKYLVDRELKSLMASWLEGLKEDTEILDDEVMINYLLNGQHRRVLVGKDNEILGVNIFDFNHCYINFRYCIPKKKEFLSEYLRYCFYTDPDILNDGRFVCDGGILGNPQLEKFKDKLNPIHKRMVFSWIKHEEGI